MAEHVLVKHGKIVHVWRNSTAPAGTPGVHEVEPGSAFIGDGWEDGSIIRNAYLVTEEEVKAECQRRILAEYPIEKQSSVHSHGTTLERDAMMNVITYLVQCSKILCAIPQIPQDYRDDKYWAGGHATQRPKSSGSQDLPAMPQPFGAQHPGMMGQQGMLPSPWGNQMPYPMAPMIFMPQAAPAPIIINGAAPSGPMVFQGPNETKVLPAPQAAPVQIYSQNPQLSPYHVPAPYGAGIESVGPVGEGSRSSYPPQPVNNLPPKVETESVDRSALWDIAEIAYGGSDAAKTNAQSMLIPLASKSGMEIEAFVKTLLFEKFQHMQRNVSLAAS